MGSKKALKYYRDQQVFYLIDDAIYGLDSADLMSAVKLIAKKKKKDAS